MERDDELRLMDETPSAEITRREAMKKMGKYGLYVPATLAVLTPAPRAFAQSGQLARISGRASCNGTPAGVNITFRLDPTGDFHDYYTSSGSNGIYSIHVPVGYYAVYITPGGGCSCIDPVLSQDFPTPDIYLLINLNCVTT